MILMCPPVALPKTVDDRETFLQRIGFLDVRTFSSAVPADWTDEQVDSMKAFLDEHGLRIGEFSAFHMGLGSSDPDSHAAALDHYGRQLGHARIMDAHCVGFSITAGRDAGPEMWSDETWQRCIHGVRELADLAEKAQMDVAAHPHIIGPLNSVERYIELLGRVDSTRLQVLMDPVNLTWPHLFFRTAEMIDQAFDELGDRIVALHAKDVTMSAVQRSEVALSVVHLDEAVPGTGEMDYTTLLTRLDRLDQDVTVHVEHLSPENCIVGQQYIRHVARDLGIALH